MPSRISYTASSLVASEFAVLFCFLNCAVEQGSYIDAMCKMLLQRQAESNCAIILGDFQKGVIHENVLIDPCPAAFQGAKKGKDY